MIGRTVLQYEVIDLLVEGGMGVVYRARDTKLNRTVALKSLPSGAAVGKAERSRLMEEAHSIY